MDRSRLIRSICTLAGVIGLAAVLAVAEDEKPGIKIAPNSADEPFADELSLPKAAEFLDAVSLNWTRRRKCGSCHTNYPYLMARPLVQPAESKAVTEVYRFFLNRAANWDRSKPRWDTEVVATASALAFYDRHTKGRLHPITRQALNRMWTLQREDGSWNWLKCNWPPAEADDYYGVVIAALGVGAAPDGYARTPQAQAGLARIQKYLSDNPAPNLHHQAMLLWASSYLPELIPDSQRADIQNRLIKLQRSDGGWSLPSLGRWQRHSGEDNDPAASPSDGYATGLVVYVLRRSGLAADHEAVQRGVQWLRTHQRRSGRWFTRSLNTDKRHYITHAGTAFAVMALRACETGGQE